MHAESIRQLVHATPFVPFNIFMVGGKTYHVDHPDFVSLSRGGRTVVAWPEGGEGERIAVLDAALIERIELANADSIS